MNDAHLPKDPKPISRLELYLDLIRWNRPAGWLLLLWPSLSALWVASQGWPNVQLVATFVVGTILMRSAGCCLNDVADRDFDKHVKRTANRPVTRGALGVKEALAVGAVLALLAFSLVCLINLATVIWSVLALMVTLVYPFAKRYVSMPQAVLGIAFSFGIPMAFAAVMGNAHPEWDWTQVVPVQAWLLLLGNLAWVLAYDTEYSMVDRDDDEKIGMKTSARTLGSFDVAFVMLCYVVYLLSWYWILRPLDLSWPWEVCLGVAALQAVGHFYLIKGRTREGCFLAFRLNHWLGATVFLGVVLGLALK